VAAVTNCDLEHARNTRAVVKLEIKSTHIGRPGRPMTRIVAVCAGHARELRRMGLEVVGN
jgi:hypothetical protein